MRGSNSAAENCLGQYQVLINEVTGKVRSRPLGHDLPTYMPAASRLWQVLLSA